MKANQGQGSKGSAHHDPASTTLGIGRRTSGEAGSTLTHETMAETGGSGGSGMTRNDACAPDMPEADGQTRQSADAGETRDVRRDAGTEESADSVARGYQDTRSQQAGGTGTGLGTPETGANQNAEDLEAPKHR